MSVSKLTHELLYQGSGAQTANGPRGPRYHDLLRICHVQNLILDESRRFRNTWNKDSERTVVPMFIEPSLCRNSTKTNREEAFSVLFLESSGHVLPLQFRKLPNDQSPSLSRHDQPWNFDRKHNLLSFRTLEAHTMENFHPQFSSTEHSQLRKRSLEECYYCSAGSRTPTALNEKDLCKVRKRIF